MGHALNFGEADSVIVLSDSASYADAAATAISNVVRGPDHEASVQSGLELAERNLYVRSAIVIRGKYIGTVGRLPRLIRIRGSLNDVFEASLFDVFPEGKRLCQKGKKEGERLKGQGTRK